MNKFSKLVNAKSYTFYFAMSSSWSRQSNAIDKSAIKATKALLLSTGFFNFSSTARRHCEHFDKSTLILTKYSFKKLSHLFKQSFFINN